MDKKNLKNFHDNLYSHEVANDWQTKVVEKKIVPTPN